VFESSTHLRAAINFSSQGQRSKVKVKYAHFCPTTIHYLIKLHHCLPGSFQVRQFFEKYENNSQGQKFKHL